MGSTRIPLSTCEFRDARGTHVQVYLFSLLYRHSNRTPKPPVPRAQRVYSSTCDLCNICGSTYSSRSGIEMLVFPGGKKQRGKGNKKGGAFLFQKQNKKYAERFKLTSRRLYNVSTEPLRHGASTI